MKKFVVIATKSTELQRRLTTALTSIGHRGEVKTAECNDDLLTYVARGNETVVFIDKFFLGFNLRLALQLMRVVNERVSFVFISENADCKYFGYRLHRNNVEGFIWNGGNEDELRKALTHFFLHGKYYPAAITEGIKNGDYLYCREYSAELTSNEMEVLLYRMKGYSYKEIPNIPEKSARHMFMRARRKQGIDTGWVDYLRFAQELGFVQCNRNMSIDSY